MIYADIQHGKVSDFIITLMTQTKAKKIRAGFIKKDGSYRVGKFDLKHRKTWKQLDGTMYKRKGKKRTTNPDENILVHDLVKKAPRKNYGKTNKRLQNIRAVVREVCGLSPYEKRILDTLKLGAGNVEKKMYKMAKQRLGTHRRAIAKREEIKTYWQKARAAANK